MTDTRNSLSLSLSFCPTQTSTLLIGIPGALEFLKQAIEGNTPRVACGTAYNFLTLPSPRVDDVIGSQTANELRQAKAQVSAHPIFGHKNKQGSRRSHKA